MNNDFETIEQKVERLEYYIDLLRDYIVDQEKFILWDWAIAHRLNEEETRGIIQVTKDFNHRIKIANSVEEYPNIDEYHEEINKTIKLESKTSFENPINRRELLQLLKRIEAMGMFQKVTQHFLEQKTK